MRVFQVLNALVYGDGVGNDVIGKHHLLEKMGYKSEIYCKWIDEKCSQYFNDISNLKVQPSDIILHHYTGFSYVANEVLESKCTKVLVYHNITPPEFFDKSSRDYEECKKGLVQIKEIAKNYDFLVCDSDFNLESLKRLGVQRDADILPILIDFGSIESYKTSQAADISGMVNFLFVGRIAPNKKQENVIAVFDYYFNYIDANSRLIFVGNYQQESKYYQSLFRLYNRLSCRNNVVFAGRMDNDGLYNHYANADIFLCMSEHEGFCIPLIESMYFGVPTLAYDSCAVGSTMGDAGVLLKGKNPEAIAKLCHTILTRREIRDCIIKKQDKRAESFSEKSITEQLRLLLNKWSAGGQNG